MARLFDRIMTHCQPARASLFIGLTELDNSVRGDFEKIVAKDAFKMSKLEGVPVISGDDVALYLSIITPKDNFIDQFKEIEDLGKPLKKGDFLIFQYEIRKDFYVALMFFMGSLLISFIGWGIYSFFIGSPYYGIDKVTIAIICFAMCRSGFQHWSAIRTKIDTIEEKMENA